MEFELKDANHHSERSRLIAGSARRNDYWSANCSGFIRQISNEKWMLGTSVVFLIAATASERVSFKMVVDRLTPYRFVVVEFVFVLSSFAYTFITLLKRGFTNKITPQMRDFPHHKLLTMALVDTLQFAGLVISATGVSPTMTVILLHASTPCIVWGSRYTFPNRAYSTVQMRGVFLISLAILISISRPIIHLYYLKHYGDYADAQSSLLYVIFAALQGFATLYKEKSIIVWSQPMDIHYLSSWLFFYQCIVAIIAAPLIYLFQGVSSGASNFPITTMAVNFHDGWSCVLGHGPPQNTAYDSSGAMCVNSNIWLLIGYVAATLAVIECIDRVLQISNQTLGRAMAFAVLVAFLALGVYDKQGESGSSLFGTNIGYADLVSIAVLLLGMEIYGQDPEPDVEVITNFSPNA